MAEFDPERFEEKYVNYFAELQRAYRNAFERMNDRYDSELIHAIDQAVLDESEPFYEDGEFRVELPEDPYGRVQGVILVEEGKFDAVLSAYVDAIERELYDVFDLEEPKA